MRWFVPTASGDIRLDDAADESCVLTADDPTTHEKKVLGEFCAEAVKHGWLKKVPDLDTSRLVLALQVPTRDVGGELARCIYREAPTWTGLRLRSGTVELVDGTAIVTAGETDKHVEAAVTVRTPDRGCPSPEPANRRASTVLKTFCTGAQWAQWQGESRFVCRGNASGRMYFVYHRGRAAALGLGHSIVRDDGTEICVWDARVPAEEEALAAKFALEHRERWLLEYPTLFDRRRTPRLTRGRLPRPPR